MLNPQPTVLANTHQPARETFPRRTSHCNIPVTAPPKAATPVYLNNVPKLNDSAKDAISPCIITAPAAADANFFASIYNGHTIIHVLDDLKC